MEVVHIVRQYRPSVGGLEDAVQNLCTNLAHRDGIKVRVVTLDRLFTAPNKKLPRYEVLDGISVTRLSYFGSSRYPIALQVLKEIRAASIVHVHAIDFFFDYLALTRFIHRKPLVASTHGGFFHTTFAALLKKIYFHTITRLSSCAYDVLCSSSENDSHTFRQIAPTKVVTIENGVNIAKWENRGSLTPQRTMIFIGRWSANKAIPVLIDLIAALKKIDATWNLLIAGIPAQETQASLRAHAKKCGVSEHVQIFEGLSDAQIGDLIGKASYVASASTYEGFGISIIEGLSAGLVPIMSPIPPFEKLRKLLGFGAVIDPSRIDACAREIENLHTRLTASTDPMREYCKALARQYDWAKVTDSFVEIYRNVLKEGKS